MKFSRIEIQQLTDSYLARLSNEQLLNLCKGVVLDLSEAHDRLNANPTNSSMPPSTLAPWDRSSTKQKNAENDHADAEEEDSVEDNRNNEVVDSEPKTPSSSQPPQQPATEPTPKDPPPKKPGKQRGAKGFGRTQKLTVTSTIYHRACECKSCGAQLGDDAIFTATGGNYVIDMELPKEGEIGLRGTNTKHLYGKTLCSCGFETCTRPNYIAANEKWTVALSEANLIGPMLLAFLCFLKQRMHATGSKAQAMLQWFGLSLSIGCINKCFREAGRAVSPLEPQLLAALRAAGLLHVDETSWFNRKVMRWLWVFCDDKVVYYRIDSRCQEVVDSVLEGFEGTLMTDGYGAYRKYSNRIRCWGHLERKGKALEESWDKSASTFGGYVVKAFESLREGVYRMREMQPKERVIEIAVYDDIRVNLIYECLRQRGAKNEKIEAFAGEVLNDQEAIFRVLNEPNLPLTNNRAEQQLRYLAILRKITYGSKSEEGCRALALLASVVDTLKQLKQDPYGYLANVFGMTRKGSDPPPIPFPV